MLGYKGFSNFRSDNRGSTGSSRDTAETSASLAAEEKLHSYFRQRSQVRHLPPKAELILEGQRSDELFMLVNGWAYRSKLLSNGRRQVLDFLLPSDLFGLSLSNPVDRTEYSVEAITDIHYYSCPTKMFLADIVSDECLIISLLSVLGKDAASAFNRLTDVGRRDAKSRTARLLVTIFLRIRKTNQSGDGRCEFPATQCHLADALGLSKVWINRVLRELRDGNVATIANGELIIHDLPALVKIAHLDEVSMGADWC